MAQVNVEEMQSVPGNRMSRLAIAFFFDEDGIVDEYYFHLIDELRKFTTRNIFVSNGPIAESARERIVSMGFEIVIRDNVGFDVWAYKAGIEYVGYENLGNYDEIMLLNHTFFGPIFPFSEMFEKMETTDCGFWGITAHKELDPNPFTGVGILPRHLNSHFISVRRPLATSAEFKKYWQKMPMITSYNDSVLTHESKFTKHFQDLGYECVVYDDDEEYSSVYPCFFNVDEAMKRRCPILKRRIFFHDPAFHETQAIDLPRALRIIRDTSDFDENLIWSNIVRTTDLRTLNTTAGLLSVLPDQREKEIDRKSIRKIAVCLHIFYVDMLDELLDLTSAISVPFDLIVTTDSEVKAQQLREACAGRVGVERVIVRVMTVNRGRDMSALFITCRDIFLGDEYDLVCRLHSKKSPQVDSARSNIFKRHMFENLIDSPGYVDNVLDLFEEKPWVGLAIPPAVHISYSTLGLGWFNNRPRAKAEAKKIGIHVKMDETTPVAAYGTMFWFRPKALRKLFEHDWQWDEFNPEPHHVDGGLAHAIERLIAYTAQDAGYTTHHISSVKQMSYNYSMLEYKFSEFSSTIAAPFHMQRHMFKSWAAAGYVLPGTAAAVARDGFAFRTLWHRATDSEKKALQPLNVNFDDYRSAKKGWQHTLSPDLATSKTQRRLDQFEHDFNVICEYIREVGLENGMGTTPDNIESKVREYLLFGWAVGLEVFALFDTQFYLRNNADVAQSDFNPLVHYILYGAAEGRQPHPLFDPAYYQKNAQLGASRDPLRAFLLAGSGATAAPHPLFDMQLYYSLYPDIAQHDENALSHYIRYGARERRKPNLLFDQDYYEAGLGASVPTDINPLVHYIEAGGPLGVDPHPLFDSRYYLDQIDADLNGQDPLTHFLSSKGNREVKPHPLFDPIWYAGQWDEDEVSENALLHYLRTGPFKVQTSHPAFDGAAYLDVYQEVKSAGMDPLIHYVRYGVHEKRKVPGFDEVEYMHRYDLKPAEDLYPFVHALKHGRI